MRFFLVRTLYLFNKNYDLELVPTYFVTNFSILKFLNEMNSL